MNETRVVHCKKHPYDIYIGRPSKWGNPFTVREYGRGKAITLYRKWIFKPEQEQLRKAAVTELKGKVLGCYCYPNPCHGDTLKEIADY